MHCAILLLRVTITYYRMAQAPIQVSFIRNLWRKKGWNMLVMDNLGSASGDEWLLVVVIYPLDGWILTKIM